MARKDENQGHISRPVVASQGEVARAVTSVLTLRLFRKRDIWVLAVGLILLQIIPALLINRLMFRPVLGGYAWTDGGIVDVGTNGVKVATRQIGSATAPRAIIYCHGNAEDVTAVDRFSGVAAQGSLVAAVEYPGYGLSDGSPTEKGCCDNARRLYDWLVEMRGFAATNIFVVGYSIGTGVAVDLASTRQVAGLWLEAGFLSIPRVITRKRLLVIDPFQSETKIGRVNCPVFMLHGTSDWIVPYSQGRALYDLAPEPKRFFTVAGAGHFDFVTMIGEDRYEDMLGRFVAGGLDAIGK